MSHNYISLEYVKLVEELRGKAADTVSHVFNRRQKCVTAIPGFHREAVSLSCSREGNSSPLFKLAGWIVALYLIGALDKAQMLVDFLQDVTHRLRRAKHGQTSDVQVLMLAEQKEQAFEVLFRVEYESARPCDRAAVRAKWVAHLKHERAVQTLLLFALEEEQTAAEQKAA